MNSEEQLQQINQVIDDKVRPFLNSHEGDIRILSFEENILRVSFVGHCANCPSAYLTIEENVKKEVLEACPYVKDVVLVQGVSDELIDFARKLLGS